ncbi:16S rRNA (cytosine(967)-C(5))-methyltransferase RsmB [uncultured Clostridium sp.]|uniref:16S rRNA (cytosine(967)-C(5))-methyltransferase RsmB n=1 Tax=uncultured Clostridium sp. TaxID=59620 RepID=UPI0025DD4890|nr:16S rRNA (cytosine(967)-C(5))-methyltransferase RsmB [uncultured Clostridium sp.]MDU4883883.1 16S rRNA (cytosine(967)-C(5))-methyltransferase RsmB [Clostridium celatum]MDU7077161.1 16S rRNA (cytosine(967)-C(5))-methyltransferase RsmB [Clostridium celatum]
MNSREVALNIINRVLIEGAYSNLVLSNELNESDLNEKDRALVTELVYGTIRRKKTLDMIISNYIKDISLMDERVLNILRMAIYQMHFLDKVPEFAACNEAVELAKQISVQDSKLVNGILRSYTKNPDDMDVKDKIDRLVYQYSYEPWFIRMMYKQYGEENGRKILSGLNATPKVTVRVNASKGDYDEVFERLEEMGYDVEEGYACPEAIIIKGGSSIENNELFKEGLITVQDESAMLVSPLLDLNPGDVALDLCAAPGGKTTHIAELLEDEGKVYSFDLHENKLSLINENLHRLGLNNVEVEAMDATKLNSKYVACADKVLIDVPCSGLGIIRKKPEIKWNKSRKSLKDLVPTQRAIMENAWMYLKNGGTMIYSTCTLNTEENQDNVEWFLNKYKDAKVEKIFLGNMDNFIYNNDGSLTILPNEYMDGFYIAKISKK